MAKVSKKVKMTSMPMPENTVASKVLPNARAFKWGVPQRSWRSTSSANMSRTHSPASTAPTSCAPSARRARPSRRRKTQRVNVTAGFRKPPEAGTVAVRAAARMKPWAKAMPSTPGLTRSPGGAIPLTQTAAAPMKTRANVPIVSTSAGRRCLSIISHECWRASRRKPDVFLPSFAIHVGLTPRRSPIVICPAWQRCPAPGRRPGP